MVWSLLLPGLAGDVSAEESQASSGTITISVEKFTLGQGYIQKPIKVAVNEGETAAQLLLRVLGEGKADYGGDPVNGFYLTGVYDPDAGAVNVPAYILDHAAEIGSRSQEAWLSQLDYTDMSGWMYTVNHRAPDVGMADYDLKAGDVMRVQYSLHGWGADIGFGWEGSYLDVADKDELTSKLAEVNSAANYATLMDNAKLRAAYEEAVAVATNMESSQESVGSALAKLSAALAELDPDKARERHLTQTLEYLKNTYATPKDGQDWPLLSLARSGYEVPEALFQTYYTSVENNLIQKSGNLGSSTEYARRILALTAAGADITDIGGYDLRDALADLALSNRQGINAYVFSLIALDTRKYEIPKLHGEDTQATREKLIELVLGREIGYGTETAGGWTFAGSNPDPDMTGMAIQALTPYYKDNAKVKAAVDRGLAWLSANQQADGGYVSWGVNNAESAAQVIVATTGLGINPHTDPRFVKNGISVVDAMMGFAVEGGGFKHAKTETRINGMATEQSTYALVAYDRFLQGKNRLYDMTDAPDGLPGGLPKGELTLPSGNQPVIAIPSGERDYDIAIRAEDKDKQVRIELPAATGKVQLRLPKGELPRIEAVRDGVTAVLPQGAEVVQVGEGAPAPVTLFGPSAVTEAQVTAKLNAGQELEAIVRQFAMGGGQRIAFSDYVTLTFPGLAGHSAVFAEQAEITRIPHFESKAAGEASKVEVFSYDAGGALVIQTRHFTDFVVYKLKDVLPPGGGNPGTPVTQTVTLAVDKQTIGKGTVIAATQVTLQAGDTAWSVLKRTLDARNIQYRYVDNSQYGSVYVQSIDGDGEFDHGQGSGWMYNVNGVYPNVGASTYTVKNGDSIQWRYTKNMGDDLKAPQGPPTTGTGPSTGAGPGAAAPGGGASDETTPIAIPANLTSDHTIKLTAEQAKAKHLTVALPTSSSHAVLLDLEKVAAAIPQLTATRGDVQLHIAQGTKLTAGGPAIRLLQAFTPTAAVQEEALVTGDGEQAKVRHAFTLFEGEQAAQFDQPLSITVKSGAANHAAYKVADSWQQLTVYASEQAASAAKAGPVYGVKQGQDLVIRTKTAADFIVYATTKQQGNGNVPGGQEQDANAVYSDRAHFATWAYDGIARATASGWLQGSDGQFRPQADITRAEFTKLLTELLALPVSGSSASVFADVQAGQWFHPYVQTAYEAELVTGYGDRFEPQATITREQMAVMIARALELPATTESSAIADAALVAPWARSEVAAVYAAGLMTGDAGRFHPQQQVSREMAAVVAVRAYDYLEGAPLPPATEPEVTEPEAPATDVVLGQTQRAITVAAAYLQRAVAAPTVSSVGGEWTVFGLARSQVKVPEAYYDIDVNNLERTLQEKEGLLHRLKYTEYDRVILALTALGLPVDDVAGYNMLQPLADYDTLVKQGINGPIFALIALDSRGYEIPARTGNGVQTSRQRLVDFILKREIPGGGWAMDPAAVEPDADMTAMALQALTSYTEQASVRAAVDRGIAWLSQAQGRDGGYASGGVSNSESAAQVVVALTGLGIDPHRDPRFVKDGHSVLDALFSFAGSGGGFYHILPGGSGNGGATPGEVDLMATDQALYALVAYERFALGLNRLYDLTDIK